MHAKKALFKQKRWTCHLTPLPKLMVLMLVILSLAACQPVQAMPERQSASADSALTAVEKANKTVIERFYEEIVNQKHGEVFDEIFDPNVVAHDLGMKPDVDMLFAGLPDLHVTVDLWILKGDMVTSVATFSGTHRGELMGVPATGKPVTWTHIDIQRVKNGKIVEVWHNIPMSDILQQIGYTLVAPAK